MHIDKKCPICKKRDMVFKSIVFEKDCKQIKLEISCDACRYSANLKYDLISIQGKLY